MSDDESDEDLKRVLALSLQESTLPRHKSTIIEISDDEDDDDDLDAPLAARSIPPTSVRPKPNQHSRDESLGPSSQPTENIPRGMAVNTPVIGTETLYVQHGLPSSGYLGLDRKRMEQERLARLNAAKSGAGHGGIESSKRKAEIAFRDSPNTRNVKAKTPIDGAISRTLPIASTAGRLPVNQNLTPVPASGLQYPNGIVKKTWVRGYVRDNDIKIEEVLQKDTLELAVLSAFQIDADWISSKLHDRTKVIWVLQAKSQAEKENWRHEAPGNYRFCFPNMGGVVNCMHSKLQLLSHGSYLRVVIPSANLVPYDWGETGVMENVCFLIDLPRLPSGQSAEPSTQFGIQLARFLVALGLDQNIVDSLKRFDFSRTGDMAFVHSIGGSHASTWQRTGYCGLGKAVQTLGSATDSALEIDFLAASIGSLNEDFIRAMYLACQGDDGLTEYRMRTKPSRGHGAETKRGPSDDIFNRCRVYFPTEDTVSGSNGGKGAGATICIQERFYNSDNFPRRLMRDCVSKRRGLLIHSKMMFVRSPRAAFAYLGSANLSEAAWGKLVTDRTTKEPKLNCRNWECGVLIPVRGCEFPGSLDSKDTKGGVPGMDIFDGVVPVPMVTPGEMYGTRKPWYFSQH